MRIRPAAVAGLFYEGDAGALRHHVEALLSGVGEAPYPFPRALIVPHAGYVYSGQTAAAAYARLRHRERPVSRVALFGPAHRVYLRGMAVPSVDGFDTPLGRVAIDSAGVEEIRDMPGVTVSDEAHREEHSLEVQLPFLQVVLEEFSLVPVVVGECQPEQVAAVMEALWRDPGTLLLVSTDLSHFHTWEEARRLDAATCERVLVREGGLTGEEACGAHALNGLMRTARGRDLEIELIDLCNSGDTAGDRRRVVGYGAFSLY
jgi:AmmeMemoRadiSam system protein B